MGGLVSLVSWIRWQKRHVQSLCYRRMSETHHVPCHWIQFADLSIDQDTLMGRVERITLDSDGAGGMKNTTNGLCWWIIGMMPVSWDLIFQRGIRILQRIQLERYPVTESVSWTEFPSPSLNIIISVLARNPLSNQIFMITRALSLQATMRNH